MSAPIATEMRLDAKAFRENTVYSADGDPIRLIANAERMEQAADTITDLLAALEPFAKAAMGVEQFDPEFPADGAALRASFDWYDKAQDEPLKRCSVRRSDLDNARAAIAKAKGGAA